jgi:hypothetical protein
MNEEPAGRPGAWAVALGVAWIAAAVWVAARLDQGWVPHDDGSFAQSAQRVLDGELPHREFAELYTGGMTFLNAGVFWLFGEDLIWLRVPMFVLFLAFVPCYYAIARRLVRGPAALVTTAFAVGWSVPVYPAAVPSWYLLFFSCFGTYLVIRHFETGLSWWLFAAGLFGGLAISFKIVGIWFVLAVVVALVAAEQASNPRGRGRRLSLRGYGLFVIAGALVTLGLVVGVLGSHLGGAELVNLVIPAAALCCIPVVAEAATDGPSARTRFRSLGGRVAPFLVGVALPVGLVTLPYVITGAVPDLIEGVLVAPRERLDYSYLSTPEPAALLWGLPVVAVLFVRHYLPRARRAIDISAVIVLAVLLVTSGTADRSYLLLWHAARALAPLVVVAGALALAFWPGLVADQTRRLVLLLVLLVAGLGSLVQYPFSAPVYFCYAAPLFALAAVGVAGSLRVGSGLLPAALLVSYAVFGLAFLDRASLSTLGLGFQVDPQTVILDGSRASIRVTPSDRAAYRTAAALLERHGSGRYAFAGPDAPELYFLSGRTNPTRSLFDFIDTSDSARGASLLRSLRDRSVTAIAINVRPAFSDPLDVETLQRLRVLYPHHARVGRFDVRWQQPTT